MDSGTGRAMVPSVGNGTNERQPEPQHESDETGDDSDSDVPGVELQRRAWHQHREPGPAAIKLDS